jgi:hypothetical protein
LAAQSFYSKNRWWPFFALANTLLWSDGTKISEKQAFLKKRLEPENNQRLTVRSGLGTQNQTRIEFDFQNQNWTWNPDTPIMCEMGTGTILNLTFRTRTGGGSS